MLTGLLSMVMLAVVLGQDNSGRVRGIRDSFSRSTNQSGALSNWVLFLLLTGVLMLLSYAWFQSRGIRTSAGNSRSLFDEAMRSLGLSGEDKILMKRLSREMRLQHPSDLLLNIREFDGTVNEWIAKHGSGERGRLVRRLQFIRRQAFSK